jgi:hypothetical protein
MACESIQIFNVGKLAKLYKFKAMNHNFGGHSLSLFGFNVNLFICFLFYNGRTNVIFLNFSHFTEANVTWHALIHVAINKSCLLHRKKFNICVHKYYKKFNL